MTLINFVARPLQVTLFASLYFSKMHGGKLKYV